MDGGELGELTAGLKALRGEAWDRLYRLTHLPLLRALRRAVGDEALAEEVLQAAFVTAVERISSFDPGRGSVDGWLLGIARRKALEAARGARRAPLDERPGQEPHAPGSAGNGGGGEEELVALALDALEPRHAEVLRRKYLQEESLEDIAAALGLKPATVGTLLHRGRGQFREAYRRLKDRMERINGPRG